MLSIWVLLIGLLILFGYFLWLARNLWLSLVRLGKSVGNFSQQVSLIEHPQLSGYESAASVYDDPQRAIKAQEVRTRINQVRTAKKQARLVKAVERWDKFQLPPMPDTTFHLNHISEL